MFIDEATIMIRSGDGGDGRISFYRGKYIPKGGPDGGNGGRGGHIYFVGDANLRTLQDFRYKRKYVAMNGEMGGKGKCFGAKGEDLYIRLPLGTIVRDADDQHVIADIVKDGQKVMVAEGGRGGVGNTAYATATRQSPNFAKAGERGEERNIKLELKLLADVALLGMPNVGKSTLLSVLTKAKAKIADYHFTTLEPQLGIAQVEDNSFVIADIPGLIEGASSGLGLGDQFLKHIERTRLFVHVLDAAGSEGRDPLTDFHIINSELEKYLPSLAERPQIVLLNKTDLTDEAHIEELKAALEAEGIETVLPICAPIQEGTQQALYAMSTALSKLSPVSVVPVEVEAEKVYDLDKTTLKVRKDDYGFHVEASWLDRFLRSINFDDNQSLQYFQRVLKERGVTDALEKAGIKEGDTVILEDLEFDYIP
ncbi:GTPase ObgE [Amygdalobacter nucleatus]|uniref:GTPase Obg n=1 Tax=Amygdalobacter nucleatus TaxID=3029274 RepID=A0A133Y7J9_9FIRM|nr:GTPase ObgE [Amygdalobacter nucleatus]KXB39202.1 Obg family GTPase CgtA [Amygdalobacter nucleatus]MDF0485470.1 GTPase ObgE [Amygdalobacter nucleatus]WEG36672.1 GTPase ObgE [Amygdalobacter nucleatus]